MRASLLSRLSMGGTSYFSAAVPVSGPFFCTGAAASAGVPHVSTTVRFDISVERALFPA